jgi:hypothetical protein
MKKLSLNIEDLSVESFTADEAKGGIMSLSNEPTQVDCSGAATQCAGCSRQICSDACIAPTVEWIFC